MLRSVFVSSTFRDMHYERDAIHTKVIPAINACAQKYGESVAACDLRWGVDTSGLPEEKSSKKVLRVCLNEIDRCQPYMIVILGYRYGWIPDPELIWSAANEKKDFSLENPDISVTELEIAYGALQNPAAARKTLFYFREIDGAFDGAFSSEDSVHKRKMDQLKAKILELPDAHVRTYHVQAGAGFVEGMDAFAAMVTEDLRNLLQSEWEENASLDAYATDQKSQWAILHERASQFVSRTDLLKSCLAEVTDRKHHLLIFGTPGSGKSTLICKIGQELEATGRTVIPIFCGNSSLSSSGSDILRYIVWEMERMLNVEEHFAGSEEAAASGSFHRASRESEHGSQVYGNGTAGAFFGETPAQGNAHTPEAWREYLEQLMELYSQEEKELVFLIDGTNQLVQDDIARKLSFLPAGNYSNIHFIISAVSRKNVLSELTAVEVGPLSFNEKAQVAQSILSGTHRELSAPVMAHILEKKQSDNPLYLSLLIRRLLMMNREDFRQIALLGDGMDAITSYQICVIDQCPASLDDLYTQILSHASTFVGGAVMTVAAQLIALSRHGLRLSDLEGLLKGCGMAWDTLDAIAWFQYLDFAFQYRNDGRIDFSHKSIREGFQAACQNVRGMHVIIWRWLYQLPDSDGVRGQELIYHLIQADEKRVFADVAASNEHHSDHLSDMAKDTVDCILADDGAWIIEMIKENFLTHGFMQVCSFLHFRVFFQILDTRHNLDIKRGICEILLEAVQKRCAVHESPGHIWEISVICDRISSVHRAYGTGDHLEAAIKYSMHSLKVKQGYLEMLLGADTYEKQLAFLREDMEGMGLAVSQPFSPEQADDFLKTLIYEARRGICVCYEDLARILRNLPEEKKRANEGKPQTQNPSNNSVYKRQALAYIRKSLAIREQIYHSAPLAAAGQDEEVDNALIYQLAAEICLDLEAVAYLELAEQYCKKAIRLCENAIRQEETTDRLLALGNVTLCMSKVYAVKNTSQSLSEAVSLCQQCIPILEKMDVREHSVQSRHALADAYNQIGNLYMQMESPDDRAKAEPYYAESLRLLQTIANTAPGIRERQNLIIAAKNAASARELSTASRANVQASGFRSSESGRCGQDEPENDISPKTAGLYRMAYREAVQVYAELKTDEALQELCSCFHSLSGLIQKADYLDKTLKTRILAEVRFSELTLLESSAIEPGASFAGNRDELREQLGWCITQYATLAEQLPEESPSMSQSGPSGAEARNTEGRMEAGGRKSFFTQRIPENIAHLLADFGISEDKVLCESSQRFYQIMKRALRLSEALCSDKMTLEYLDILAVTLTKYMEICIRVSPQEWKERNDQLLTIAHYLYQKTGREKYLQMVAVAELGKSFFRSGSDRS